MDQKQFFGKLAYLDAREISSFEGLTEICVEAARKSGATVLNYTVTPFPGGSKSICVTLSESHLSCHEYPEYNAAFFDIFTCGQHCEPTLALEYIKERLQCKGEVISALRGD